MKKMPIPSRLTDYYKRKKTSIFSVVIGIGISISLTGCTKTAEQEVKSHFNDYQKRLQNVLKVDDIAQSVESLRDQDTLPKLPRKRDRSIPIPENTLSLYEFIRLENCELKRMVADKNNQLGKHMQPANGMIYEVRVRQEIDNCLPIETNVELQDKLRQAQAFKDKTKVADMWRYTLGATWYDSFTFSDEPIRWGDEDTLLAGQQALHEINQVIIPVMVDHNTLKMVQEKKSTLNQSLQTLENSGAYGRLIKSLAVSIHELKFTNKILQRASQHNMCYKHNSGALQPNKQLDFFNNVVANYFAKDIQVYLARLKRDGDLLLKEQKLLLTALEQASKAMSQHSNEREQQSLVKIQNFQRSTEALMSEFTETIKQHVSEIQKVQKICN